MIKKQFSYLKSRISNLPLRYKFGFSFAALLFLLVLNILISYFINQKISEDYQVGSEIGNLAESANEIIIYEHK